LVIFLVVSLLSLVRWSKYPWAVAMDMQHPDQHPFLATIPISIMLLAGLGVSVFWNVSENLNTGLRLTWAAGSLFRNRRNTLGDCAMVASQGSRRSKLERHHACFVYPRSGKCAGAFGRADD